MALYIIDAFYLLMLSLSLILLWHSSRYHDGGHRIDCIFNPDWNQFPVGWSWIYRWWQVLAGYMFKTPRTTNKHPRVKWKFSRGQTCLIGGSHSPRIVDDYCVRKLKSWLISIIGLWLLLVLRWQMLIIGADAWWLQWFRIACDKLWLVLNGGTWTLNDNKRKVSQMFPIKSRFMPVSSMAFFDGWPMINH